MLSIENADHSTAFLASHVLRRRPAEMMTCPERYASETGAALETGLLVIRVIRHFCIRRNFLLGRTLLELLGSLNRLVFLPAHQRQHRPDDREQDDRDSPHDEMHRPN